MASAKQPLNSRLMIGWVRHRRFWPKSHALKYPVFMWYLDIDEIDDVLSCSRLISKNRLSWVNYQRDDYYGDPECSLKESVIDKISSMSSIAKEDIHRVCMLTNLRMIRFIMNPVTFYYVFDKSDQLIAIMPEITNTPWKERFQYVLPLKEQSSQTTLISNNHKGSRFKLFKQFHISPFHDMDMQYDWRLGDPRRDSVHFHLENWKQGSKIFDATMALRPEHITARSIQKTLIRFPWMTVKVASGIYWHALKLGLKGVPFFSHPKKNKEGKYDNGTNDRGYNEVQPELEGSAKTTDSFATRPAHNQTR